MRLGEFGGPITERLKKVEDVWRGAGFRVKVFDDIDQLVWEKLLCNCAYSGPCAIAECTIGEVMTDPDLSRISAACATEGYESLYRTKSSSASRPGRLRARVRLEDPARAAVGAALDLMAKRKSEIDVINGSIPRPTNQALTALVRAKERRLGCT